MKNKHLYVKEYTYFVGGLYETQMICMFNTDRISESEIDELITSGEVSNSIRCVTMTKVQYENLKDIETCK